MESVIEHRAVESTLEHRSTARGHRPSASASGIGTSRRSLYFV